MKRIGDGFNLLSHPQLLQPIGGNSLYSIKRPGQLPDNGGGGISVVAQVRRGQHCFSETVRMEKTLQRRLQRLDRIAGARHLTAGFSLILALGERDYLGLGQLLGRHTQHVHL